MAIDSLSPRLYFYHNKKGGEMKAFSNTSWVGGLIVVIVLLYGIVAFNKISAKDEQVTTSWTPLASALDLRYASVPALARSIIMYTGRDDETTKDLMRDQQSYMAANTVLGKATAANEIEEDLTRISVEAGQLYAGIQSHYQFTSLMDNFASSQQKMGSALDAYNLAADAYNTYIRKFPNNIIAAVLGFKRAAYIKKAIGSK